MKKALLLAIILSIVSCKGQKKESKELVKKANTIFWKSKHDKKFKIDSCLVLINKAIEIDDENFGAYEAKSSFLAYKKDIKGLLKNNEKMIELHPKQPLWKIHRGLYLELNGEKVEAEKYYDQGISEYQNLLLDPKQNNEFNLRMEYLSAIETKGDLKKAEIELKKMSVDFPDNQFLKLYLTDHKFMTKKELFEVWKKGFEE